MQSNSLDTAGERTHADIGDISASSVISNRSRMFLRLVSRRPVFGPSLSPHSVARRHSEVELEVCIQK